MKAPNLSFEEKLWKKGFKFIAGVDEVGRGCLAGPVVAGCVVFDKSITTRRSTTSTTGKKFPNIPRIDDSKKLKPREREAAAKWIRQNTLWGIGVGKVSEINRLGMSKTTNKAFRRAVAELNKKSKLRVDFLLIDAFYIPYIRGLPVGRKIKKNHRRRPVLRSRTQQLAITDGDEKSLSIAAASIIAKVYRDKLMKRLSKNYPQYGWGRNKGYGTRQHQEAIKEYGVTRYHRKVFVRTFLGR